MASTTLKKSDPFEAVIIELVEERRSLGAVYPADPNSPYSTSFDKVAAEVPIPGYDAKIDAFAQVARRVKQLSVLIDPATEADPEVVDQAMVELATYSLLLLQLQRRPQDPRQVALKALGLEG